MFFFCVYFIKESKHDTIFASKYNGKIQKLCDKWQYLQMIEMIRRKKKKKQQQQ